MKKEELVHRRCACGHTFFDLPKVPQDQYFSPMFKCKYCLAEEALPNCSQCGETKVEPPGTICFDCLKAQRDFEREEEEKREREFDPWVDD